MKWLEIIECRSAGGNRLLLKSQLPDLIEEVKRKTNDRAVMSYRHATMDTDFSIHLFHESECTDNGGSALGLCIASALKEFGLVHHSVWIEMQGK